MKLTPAQVAIRLMCGRTLPTGTRHSMAENIKRGHEMLVRMTPHDFGYDLVAWHQHLKDTDVGGYNFGKRRGEKIPDGIQTALDNLEWQQCVAELRTEQESQTPD